MRSMAAIGRPAAGWAKGDLEGALPPAPSHLPCPLRTPPPNRRSTGPPQDHAVRGRRGVQRLRAHRHLRPLRLGRRRPRRPRHPAPPVDSRPVTLWCGAVRAVDSRPATLGAVDSRPATLAPTPPLFSLPLTLLYCCTLHKVSAAPLALCPRLRLRRLVFRDPWTCAFSEAKTRTAPPLLLPLPVAQPDSPTALSRRPRRARPTRYTRSTTWCSTAGRRPSSRASSASATTATCPTRAAPRHPAPPQNPHSVLGPRRFL